LIRLDEIYKFTKYEAPFGVACGHRQWSREGKKLAVLSSISESRNCDIEIDLSSIEILDHKFMKYEEASRYEGKKLEAPSQSLGD
jgi:hypothetical protein